MCNYYRYACGHCAIMSTRDECVCCREIVRVVGKVNDLDDPNIPCITDNPGFSPVCLNPWVLQDSCYQYQQGHGTRGLPPKLHKLVMLLAQAWPSFNPFYTENTDTQHIANWQDGAGGGGWDETFVSYYHHVLSIVLEVNFPHAIILGSIIFLCIHWIKRNDNNNECKRWSYYFIKRFLCSSMALAIPNNSPEFSERFFHILYVYKQKYKLMLCYNV